MSHNPTDRTEKDLLGERQIPAQSLSGIHTLRAVENFGLARRPVAPELIHAFGAVKLACARVNHQLGQWDPATFAAIEAACREMHAGLLDGHVSVDALQGGAGTSTNLCVNEVLANRALQLLGLAPGDYGRIHPLDDLNLHQSTNDTYPTALRVAALIAIRDLEQELVSLQESFQIKEKEFAHIVKVGRTEMQDAVLLTLGREMSAWAEAFNRDRWRVYKCQERLRVVNLGGTAVGTGLGAPRKYIFQATDELRRITGLPLARAENLVEATQNADVFAEVSGILKACAVNLWKVSSDLRLLSSGPSAGIGEIRLPERQAGSSIMPGKVNPVIPEAVTQAAILCLAHDQAISMACAAGSLELNPFLPLVAECLLEQIRLLSGACRILNHHCVRGIVADEETCRRGIENGTACVTALVERLGYQRAQELAGLARSTGKPAKELVAGLGWLTPEEFEELVSPEAVNRLGSDPEVNRPPEGPC